MLEIFAYILFIPLIICFLHWCTFANSEGKDERGQIIMGKVSQIIWSLTILGGAFLLIIDVLFNLSKVSFQLGLLNLLSIVMIINSILIIRFKKVF